MYLPNVTIITWIDIFMPHIPYFTKVRQGKKKKWILMYFVPNFAITFILAHLGGYNGSTRKENPQW